jgi:glutaredoxin 3
MDKNQPVISLSTERPMNLPILYVKRGCTWCDDVILYLKQQKIEVQTFVVSSDREAMQEMVALSNQSKAPTLDWHGHVLADFGVEELVPFLKKHGVG